MTKRRFALSQYHLLQAGGLVQPIPARLQQAVLTGINLVIELQGLNARSVLTSENFWNRVQCRVSNLIKLG